MTRAEFDRPQSEHGDPAAQRRLCAGMRPAPLPGMRASLEARTVFFDQQVIGAIAAGIGQVVILGAGYDDRALRFRTPGVRFFELDHPATQAFKLRQVEGLRPRARELRHVAVDFTRETLGDALARVGHDTAVPTAWVFEGVISYLAPPDVAKAIEAMAARSAPGSRLLATYNEPSWIRSANSVISSRSHEPQRASFTRETMRSLLAEHGFVVRSDRDGRERAARWDLTPKAVDRFWRFHHVVIADVEG